MYQFSRKRIFQQITVALETKFHQSVHPVSEWSQDYYHYSVYIFTILEKNTIEKLLVSPPTCTGTYIFSVFRLRAFAICHASCCLFSRNVWCIKIRTKLSSALLLCLVRFLMHQMLVSLMMPDICIFDQWYWSNWVVPFKKEIWISTGVTNIWCTKKNSSVLLLWLLSFFLHLTFYQPLIKIKAANLQKMWFANILKSWKMKMRSSTWIFLASKEVRIKEDGTGIKIKETYSVHLFAINGCCTQQVTEASQSRKFEDDQILMKNLGGK